MLSREWSIYLLSTLTDFAYIIFVFTTSRFMAESHATMMELGILGAIYSISYTLNGLIAGRLSDRWPRNKMIVLGSGALFITMLVCSQWASRQVFYVMAVVAGLALGMIYPASIAMLTEGYKKENSDHQASRRLLRFCIAWNIGLICGQPTAGWLFSIKPTLPFVIGMLAALVVIFITFRLRDQVSKSTDSGLHKGRGDFEPEPRARVFAYLGWMSNVSSSIGISLILYLFPYQAHELNIGSRVHGLMLASNRMAVVSTYLIMHQLPFWRYRLSTSLLAQLCAACGLLVLAYGTSISLLTTGLVLVGVLLGYTYFSSIFYSTMGFADKQKGMSSGMHEATLAFGHCIGTLGGGFLGTWLGPRAPYQACVGVMALSILFQISLYTFLKVRRPPADHNQNQVVAASASLQNH